MGNDEGKFDPKSWSITVQGPKNPALVALSFFEWMFKDDPSAHIDEGSFRAVAERVGDVEGEGFIVRDLSDVQKLCELGRFSVTVTSEYGLGYHRQTINVSCRSEAGDC